MMANIGNMYGPNFTFLGIPACDLDKPETYKGADVVIVGAPIDSGTSLKARVASLDPRLEQAAMDIYANEVETFRYVTLPLVMPGIAGAALLAFSLSFDDFIITNFNSGNVSTFPKFVWVSSARGIPPEANVIGSAIFFIALIIVVVGQVGSRQRSKT